MDSAASTEPAGKVTKAALARLFDVSRQAIGDLVARGILTEDEHGLVDVDAAREAIANNVRPSSKIAQTIGTAQVPAPAAAPDDGIKTPTDENTAVTSFHVARTLNEAANARMAQLKLRKMQRELITVAAVKSTLASVFSTARESFMQIPARLSAVLAAEADPGKVHQMLEEELHRCLAQLAAAPARIDDVDESEA